MSDNALWPQLKYHPVQAALWVSRERFCYVPCGRQSGKTELAMRRLVRYLPVRRPWPDPKYFYGGPTFAQAKRTAWNRLLNLIPKNWIDSVSLSELSIKTVFGSELFVTGLDKPQRIEGGIYDGGVIDENSDIKPGTFDLSILPALTWRSGWCWFIGVPKRFGYGAVEYRDRYEQAARGELPDSAAFTWPSEGVVPPELLEYARKTMDVRDYGEQFNATFLSASGGIFHAFDREYNVRPCSYDPNLPIVVGSDYNVSPMSWVLGHIKGEVLQVFDEIWLRDTNTPETLNVLLSRYGNHKGGFQMYVDASARARKTSAYMSDYAHIANDARLRVLGRTMHYTTSNPSIADRFASTNARICNGAGQRNLFIDPNVKHLIHDLEVRTYKLGTREADDSNKDSGHPSDALGYILHRRWPLNLTIPNMQIVTIRSVA